MTSDHMYGLLSGGLGACGGMIVLSSIRQIDTRAHPMTIINAFVWAVVLVTGVAVAFMTELVWPKSPVVWASLVYIGLSGFLMVSSL
ncbi:hypothetical protein F5Y17DRAFT_430387, partial [Xylariaceae sp. FL0594]